MTASLTLEPVDALDVLAPAWSGLAHDARNVFATWEWTALWWRHFGRGRELDLAAATDARGRVAAIVPLYYWRSRPGRVLRFLGHGTADQLGPICGPADRNVAAAALLSRLEATRGRWDVLLAENLCESDGWGRLLGGTCLRRESSPLLVASSGWDGWLAGQSANFRQQVRRRERALSRGHEVRFRLAHDRARLQADLDVLFALHRARWPGRSSSFAGMREPFHREFAACALERGWLRLWILEVDAAPVAAWYGFRFAGVESYYQAGRDPAWDAASVGFVLLAHSIRAALEDGVSEYRLLRGDDPYKARFATAGSPLETVALSSGGRGRALVAAAAALRTSPKVRRALRARLEA